jgi:hypothetical protein
VFDLPPEPSASPQPTNRNCIGPVPLEHDPEKWAPVFRKDHAQSKGWSEMTIRRKVITL